MGVSHLFADPSAGPHWQRLLLLAAAAASALYAGLWDVMVDWELRGGTSSLPHARSAESPVFLRKALHFSPAPWIYHAAVLFNSAARAASILPIACVTLYPENAPAAALLRSKDAVFVLQAVEVLRRFVWLALRIEAHAVKAGQAPVLLVQEQRC